MPLQPTTQHRTVFETRFDGVFPTNEPRHLSGSILANILVLDAVSSQGLLSSGTWIAFSAKPKMQT